MTMGATHSRLLVANKINATYINMHMGLLITVSIPEIGKLANQKQLSLSYAFNLIEKRKSQQKV